MTALATVADLEVRLRVAPGSIEGVDRAAAQAALDDASALVAAAAASAGLPAPWTPEAVPPEVRRVAIGVSLRTYRNPDGYASENFGGAYSYTLAQDETSSYLTAGEEALVIAAAEREAGTPRRFTGSLPTPSAYAAAGELLPWWA